MFHFAQKTVILSPTNATLQGKRAQGVPLSCRKASTKSNKQAGEPR